MSEHKHGSMDITDHEKTFASFVGAATKVSIGILIFLVLLAMVNG